MHRLIALLVAAVLVGAGCASGGLEAEVDQSVSSLADSVDTTIGTAADQPVDAVEETEVSAAPVPTVSTSSTDESDHEVVDRTHHPRIAATAAGPVAVHDAPGGTEHTVLAATTSFGSPTTMLVVRVEGDWLEVALPLEPHGQRGWVHEDQITLAQVHHRVEVDLSTRQLTVYEHGEAVLTTIVAVGSEANPTPTGTDLFVTDVLRTGDDASPYGPFALGVAAWSTALSEFGAGDGQIGIHGTNDPMSIGQAVSHGCVRVPNDVVVQLSQMLPLGTPVDIA